MSLNEAIKLLKKGNTGDEILNLLEYIAEKINQTEED